MPKRVTTLKVPTSQLQGDDSYIQIKPLPYSVAKQARKFMRGDVMQRIDISQNEKEKIADEESVLTEKMIFESLVGWNWVDDTGESLPLPKTTEDLDRLTAEEVTFIVESISGLTGPEAKNSTSASSTT